MGILNPFDPRRDGLSFQNFDTATLDWDLFRRTYLGIWPTNDPIAAPLDAAFFEIFTKCAAPGNCGGLSMLTLTIWQLGGYFGFGSPAFFYAGGSNLHPPAGPARTDLYQTLNILQARQFSAPGIRNFIETVNAGELNDGFAAFTRIQDGLASGNFHLLSLANSLFGEAAHTIVPIRADVVGGTRTLHVWDPNRPYDDYPQHYDNDLNKIVITGPTQWRYDQTGGGLFSSGKIYDGSNNGWFFAVPSSEIRHKASQPISVGFIIANLTLLFVSNTGEITQVEDDDGRRLFATAGENARRSDLETAADRRLMGAAPWPWTGGVSGAPAGVYLLHRPPGSAPLTVTVTGGDYRLRMLSADQLTEITPTGAGRATDRIRIEGDVADRAVELRTSGARRRFNVRHVQQAGAGDWRSVRVLGALVTDDALRVDLPATVAGAQLSGPRARRDVDVEFERFQNGRLKVSTLAKRRIPVGEPLAVTPETWRAAPRAKRRSATA
jgi:hypothetical protein